MTRKRQQLTQVLIIQLQSKVTQPKSKVEKVSVNGTNSGMQCLSKLNFAKDMLISIKKFPPISL